ncbi:MAG: hypothetical protein KDI15_14655, partial [Thiothrix sp.]|nr:hypothetical protein [Thiothrix sp.]
MSADKLVVGRDSTELATYNRRYFVSYYRKADAPTNQFEWVADINLFEGGTMLSDVRVEGNDVGVSFSLSEEYIIVGAPYVSTNDASGFAVVCIEPTLGCSYGCNITYAIDGTACNDTIDCTTNDQCVDGRCLGNGSDDLICGASIDECSPVVCDTCYGCVVDLQPDGNTCDGDTYSCTVYECFNGTCIFLNDTGECSFYDTDCVTYSCDVDHLSPPGINNVTGCYPTLLNGTECGANGTCISSGICINGTCNGVLAPVDTPCPETIPCVISALCDAFGGCTNYTVNATFCPDTLPAELVQCVNRTCDPSDFMQDENGCVDDILTGIGCNDTLLCTVPDT